MSDKPEYEISQWLQILKEPWRRKCLKQWKIDKIRRPSESQIHSAIANGFTWPHGEVQYFYDLYHELESNPYPYVQSKYHHLLK